MFSNDGSASEQIVRYDGQTGAPLGVFVDTGVGGFGGGSAMDFGPDGHLYVATNTSAGVIRFDGATGEFLGTAASGNGIRRVSGLDFGPDGNLYVLDSDGTINTSADRILQFDSGTNTLLGIFVAPGALDDTADFTFGPDGHLYVPEVRSSEIRRFSGTTGEFLGVFASMQEIGEPPSFRVTFGPDGNAYSSNSNGIIRFDGASGTLIDSFVSNTTGQTTFMPPGASTDLAVSLDEVPGSALIGDDLSIQYRVTNPTATDAAVDEWVDVLYLSRDDILDPLDMEFGRILHEGGLGGGASYIETLTVETPQILPGDYHVFVVADRLGQVPDLDRSNNVAASSVPIEVLPFAEFIDPAHTIAVGRSLSTWATDGLIGNELTVTYTVYNLTVSYVADATLQTTLEPNVQFASATVPPTIDGQSLSWEVGRLGPLEHFSVDVSVTLDDTASLQIDSGASAGAVVNFILNVDDNANPATLRSDALDETLLAGTIDANSDDVFIRAKAAELNQDVAEIFAFMTQQIGYESYTDSLRGARGTLWSQAGNSLDQSSLMIALLRASGVPARYAAGELAEGPAQELILSMFDEPLRVLGYVEPGSPVSDPANDAVLLAETAEHFWVQFDNGAEIEDADPSFADARLGQSFAAPEASFAEVDDARRHHVDIRLLREIAVPAVSALTGGSPLSVDAVLEHSFSTAELVGMPLTIGHFVNRNVVAGLSSLITNTYSPFLLLGQADIDPSDDELIHGIDYEEVYSGFAFGNQVLTGLTLEIDVQAPGRAAETYTRVLLDRIGTDIRANGGTPDLNLDDIGSPALSELDVTTVNVLPGLQNPFAVALQQMQMARVQAALAEYQTLSQLVPVSGPENTAQLSVLSRASRLMQLVAITTNETNGQVFAAVADESLAQLQEVYLTKAYYDSPRLIISQTQTTGGNLNVMLDLRKNDVRTIANPGQIAPAGLLLEIVRGLLESTIEGDVVTNVTGVRATAIDEIFALTGQDIPLVSITADNLRELDDLTISGVAKVRIADAVLSGKGVLTPAAMVSINGAETIGWLEMDLETGETISVMEDGGHLAIAEYTAVISNALNGPLNLTVSAFIGAVNGMALSQIHFTGEFVKGLASGLPLERAVQIAKAKVTTDLIHRAVDEILSAGTGLALGNLIGGDNGRWLQCLVSFAQADGADATFLAAAGCLRSEISSRLGVSSLEASLKGGIVLGMSAGVMWITYNFPGDPPVFPFLSTPLRPALPSVPPEAVGGVNVQIVPEPLLYYPYKNSHLRTIYTAQIQNTGPEDDRFQLSVDGLPDGYEVLTSLPEVMIPAGETAEIGITIRPNGPSLDPPGTVVPFNVTATSFIDLGVSASAADSFTLGDIHAVGLEHDEMPLTTSGLPLSTRIRVTATGNVTEDVDFSLNLPPQVSAEIPDAVRLQPGESVDLVLTLSLDQGLPPGVLLRPALSAHFGEGLESVLPFPVEIVAPGLEAIGDAMTALSRMGKLELTNQLDDLRHSVTAVIGTPGDEVAKSETIASLDAIVALLDSQSLLADQADEFLAVRDEFAAASTAEACLTAIERLGEVLSVFADFVIALSRSDFDLVLSPNSRVVQPLVPVDYLVQIQNVGTETTTYDLAVAGLPAGVTSQLADSSLTIAPGQFGETAVTLTQTSDTELATFDFRVDVSVHGVTPAIGKSATGTMQARREFISVTGVDVTSRFVEGAGVQVAVSADLLNAVNQQRDVLVAYTVTDPNGQQVFASATVPAVLTVQTSSLAVELGTFATSGLAEGQYTIEATVTETGGAAIPGGSKTTPLLIGSPISALLDVSPQSLPPGTSLVANTLQIDANVLPAGELELVGQLLEYDLFGNGSVINPVVSTDVVINGDYAYVAAGLVSLVVDVSDPTDPQFIGSFLGSKNLEIEGNWLYSMTQLSGQTGLQVFALDDPEDPSFRGSTGLGYVLAADLIVSGAQGFFSTNFVGLSRGEVIEQFGDVISVDLATPFPVPAQDALDDVLFDTFGTTSSGDELFPGLPRNGGPFNMFQMAMPDADTLYVASTTSTGTDVNTDDLGQPAAGIIRMVDVTDPADVFEAGTLEIPGTILVQGIALDGDRALMVGSQGGWRDPYTDINDIGPVGNLVVALLDISDVAHPKLIGTPTVINRSARGLSEVVAVGNDRFAFGSLGSPDDPQLFLIDASDPANPVVSKQIAAPGLITRMHVDGDLLYTATGAGLFVYSLGGVEESITASVQIPKGTGVTVVDGSFSLDPTSVTEGVDFDTLVWELTLDAGDPSQSLTWDTLVADLEPGETRSVTLETTIDFTSYGAAGQIQLPPQDVFAGQVLSLDPAARIVRPGESATFTLTVDNPAGLEATHYLAVMGIPQEWAVEIASQVSVAAGSSVDVPLTITSDPFAPLADFGFVVTATMDDVSTSVQGLLSLAGEPVLPETDTIANGVIAELLPVQPTAGQGTAAHYQVRVFNTGSETETFDLSLSGLPAGFEVTLEQTSVEVPPGAFNFREVTLTIVPPVPAPVGEYPFEVQAVSSSEPDVTDTVRGALSVRSWGVDVRLIPSSTTPGSLVDFVVTNTGENADTFDLSLAAPAAVVARLSTEQVTLAAGESQIVQVEIGEIDFAFPGSLDLTGMATSRTDASVYDADRTAIAIGGTLGIAATFDPPVKDLSKPATTQFMLFVENLGNLLDQFTAAIIDTSGPVTARLMDLDSQPTQSIARFNLPGLSDGVLLLEATLTEFGEGTVTVQVMSLSDPSVTTTAVARIASGMPDLVSTSLDVTDDHVSAGNAEIAFTIENLGGDAGPFDVEIVLSDDPTLGGVDDLILHTVTIPGLASGASITETIIVALPKALLNARALREDPPGFGFGHVSTAEETIHLRIDPLDDVPEAAETNNTARGAGLDSDNVTYFPWDLDRDGAVTSLDAVYVTNRIGQLSPPADVRADFDGDGAVTTLDAIAVVNRVGYLINPDVFEPSPAPAPVTRAAIDRSAAAFDIPYIDLFDSVDDLVLDHPKFIRQTAAPVMRVANRRSSTSPPGTTATPFRDEGESAPDTEPYVIRDRVLLTLMDEVDDWIQE